jgi:hypothetical protein
MIIMKKSVYQISKFILILGLLWIPDTVNTQDLKLAREQQKEVSRTEKIIKYKALGALLENRRFVFKADSRSDAEHYYGRVGADRNYVRVDSMNVFIQLEGWSSKPKPPSKMWEGSIVSWELVKNEKNLYYDLQFKINTVIENYYMFIDYDSTAKLKIGSLIYLGCVRQL